MPKGCWTKMKIETLNDRMHKYHASHQPRCWHKHVEDGCTWMYPACCANPADHLHVETQNDKRGYGGRTLDFTLVDGSVCALRGPWHSSPDCAPDSVRQAIEHTHATCGAIGKRIVDGVVLDLMYHDTSPVVGEYDRIEKLAFELAHRDQTNYVYYVATCGGAHGGSTSLEHDYEGNPLRG